MTGVSLVAEPLNPQDLNFFCQIASALLRGARYLFAPEQHKKSDCSGPFSLGRGNALRWDLLSVTRQKVSKERAKGAAAPLDPPTQGAPSYSDH